MTADGSTIGGRAVPLVGVSSKTDTVKDYALDVVVGYLAAILRTYAESAWHSVAPGEPIVRRAFTHDPQEYEFNQNDLPALYMFRTGSARNAENLSEDYRIHTDGVRLFWVLPPGSPDTDRRRSPIIQAVGKLIDLKIDRVRDPCYVLANDPDPTKMAEGTVVIRAAGLNWIKFLQWKLAKLAIQIGEGAARRVYQALDVTFEFEESITQGFADISNPSSVDAMFAIDGAKDTDGNPLPAVPFSELIG